MTLKEAVELATTTLSTISDSAKLDAQLLLCHVCKIKQTKIIAHPEQALNEQQLEIFTSTLNRRAKGEPLAYITGTKEFWSLELMVNEQVLIPRPDTELLVELALKEISNIDTPRILELGTGSGAIAVALAKERENCDITATDISLPALELAKLNAKQHQADITFIHSDWYKSVPEKKYDVVISNPPYISISDTELDQFVSQYEPKQALLSEKNGLHALTEIIKNTPNYLLRTGSLIVEHGFQQADLVSELFANANYNNVSTHKDLAGNLRCTMGNT
ncbi:MAG: peptide chain release factor N(5)-glutamine methyltransferase [Gammaproteobacteria bacterium]|nr:MAG: peptide chain release factor N(5)-glutamine methyltransferase [Gammaproteobacteria bacterium]